MKKALWLYWALCLLLSLAASPVWAASADAGCRGCHGDFQPPMPPPGKGAALSCLACHGGNGQARDQKAGHAGLAANPSALDAAGQTCGKCHAPWVARVKVSPMASNMGIINHTRYLWGAQKNPGPRFAVKGVAGMQAMPHPQRSGRAVDDLLRRRCLRCHLWDQGADLAGARRSAGCAACHRPHEKGKPPQGHGLTKKIPVSQCLTCHASCGAGPEYVGKTARDDTEAARFLAANRDSQPLWQGRDWRPMRPDLHAKAGLACIDCHVRSEVMGDGQVRQAGLSHVGLRCTSCHGQPGAPPQGPKAVTILGQELPHTGKLAKGMAVTLKLSGREKLAPFLAGGSQAPVAHQVPEHIKVACHACHGATNPTDWGVAALLEARPGHLPLWQRIAAQGDPQLLAALASPGRATSQPKSQDLLSKETRPGVWVLSPFFRRHEWRVYGLGPGGRTYLLAPPLCLAGHSAQAGRLPARQGWLAPARPGHRALALPFHGQGHGGLRGLPRPGHGPGPGSHFFAGTGQKGTSGAGPPLVAGGGRGHAERAGLHQGHG